MLAASISENRLGGCLARQLYIGKNEQGHARQASMIVAYSCSLSTNFTSSSMQAQAADCPSTSFPSKFLRSAASGSTGSKSHSFPNLSDLDTVEAGVCGPYEEIMCSCRMLPFSMARWQWGLSAGGSQLMCAGREAVEACERRSPR